MQWEVEPAATTAFVLLRLTAAGLFAVRVLQENRRLQAQHEAAVAQARSLGEQLQVRCTFEQMEVNDGGTSISLLSMPLVSTHAQLTLSIYHHKSFRTATPQTLSGDLASARTRIGVLQQELAAHTTEVDALKQANALLQVGQGLPHPLHRY